MTLKSFASIASELPKNDFIRIHKSYLVSVKNITLIEKDKIHINNNILPIGRSYKSDFLKTIENLSI